MTNEEIIKYIYKERKSIKDKKDNSRMKSFLNKIGNPEKDLKFVHVTGTNGKGSTTTMIANILKQSGLKIKYDLNEDDINKDQSIVSSQIPSSGININKESTVTVTIE